MRCLLLLALLTPLSAQPKPAAQRAVTLLQKVAKEWKFPCLSCHNQILPAIALQSARAHGLTVDETLAQLAARRDYKPLQDFDGAIRVDQLIDPSASEGSMLLGAHAAGVKPSLVTAAYARHIAANQLPDGSWLTFDTRPPSSHSEIAATAIAARVVSLYLPNPESRVTAARKWLKLATAADTESRTYRLLGLVWTGAQLPDQQAAASLASLQRPDGSWSQTPISKESDAYSTAQALYALRVSESWDANNPNFLRGIDWLLKNQAADGSWHVKSRINTPAPIIPPYFESGFPYGHDQFLSMAATAWAVRALAEALPEIPNPPAPLDLPAFDESNLSWARTAMFGTPAEVAKIDPNAATPLGTTVLMIASDNPEKIKVLLQRGANPKAVNKAGLDALIIAGLFRGNTASADLLLKAGIPAVPGRKVRYDATALSHAVITNDSAMVDFLLAKGANPNFGMRLLGGSSITLLNLASGWGNAEIIRSLAKAGAKMEDPDSVGMTSLSTAAISLRPDAIKALLELGANPKHKDSFGLTPLDHTRAIADTPREAAERLLSTPLR